MITVALRITQASVYDGGRLVAAIRWSGKVATVVWDATTRPKAIGRVMPAGYTQGALPDGLFDAWTARHPAVHTPSDTIIASGLSWNAAVEHIIKEASDG